MTLRSLLLAAATALALFTAGRGLAEPPPPPAAASPASTLDCNAPGNPYAYAASLIKDFKQLLPRDPPRALEQLSHGLDELRPCRGVGADTTFLALRSRALSLLGQTQETFGGSFLPSYEKFAADYEEVLGRLPSESSEKAVREIYLRTLADADVVLGRLALRPSADPRESFWVNPIALQILASRDGRLLEIAKEIASAPRDGADGRRLRALRAQRAILALRGRAPAYQEMARAELPGAVPAGGGTDGVTGAIGRLAAAEFELAWRGRRRVDGGTSAASRAITLAEVAGHLEAGTLVLCYTRFPQFGDEPARFREEYALWGLDAEKRQSAKYIGDIDSGVRRFLDLLRDPGHRGTNQKKLDEAAHLLFSELIGSWTDKKPPRRIVVIADGILQAVPFAALKDDDGAPLVATTEVVYATGLRELVRKPPRRRGPGPIVLVGQPSADAPQAAPAISYLTPPLSRGAQAGYEIDGVKELLPGAVSILSGADASEEKVKAVAAPSILHVAAPCVLLQNDDADFLVSPETPAEHPVFAGTGSTRAPEAFLRSFIGLAEYGRVRSLRSEDGVLTPLEIADMDLDGTELAVVSRCSTGTRPITRGEPVQGLRNALAVGGARTQVVSLWAAGDTATRAFMVRFYSLLRRGMPVLRALAETQRSLLADPQLSDPFYWAAFTASGEDGTVSFAER